MELTYSKDMNLSEVQKYTEEKLEANFFVKTPNGNMYDFNNLKEINYPGEYLYEVGARNDEVLLYGSDDLESLITMIKEPLEY